MGGLAPLAPGELRPWQEDAACSRRNITGICLSAGMDQLDVKL